jgi:hypothetical protein
MKFHTARTRRTALTRIARYLTETERDDIRTVKHDALAERIREAEADLSEGTIQTYLTRIDRTLSAYQERDSRSQAHVREQVTLNETSVQEVRVTLAVPLRGGILRISNLPRDLTNDEVALVCAALRAYAESNNR